MKRLFLLLSCCAAMTLAANDASAMEVAKRPKTKHVEKTFQTMTTYGLDAMTREDAVDYLLSGIYAGAKKDNNYMIVKLSNLSTEWLETKSDEERAEIDSISKVWLNKSPKADELINSHSLEYKGFDAEYYATLSTEEAVPYIYEKWYETAANDDFNGFLAVAKQLTTLIHNEGDYIQELIDKWVEENYDKYTTIYGMIEMMSDLL